MAIILVRFRARQDIQESAAYLEGATICILKVAAMPKAGSLYGFRKTALEFVRRWPLSQRTTILHAIHGARDIESILNA